MKTKFLIILILFLALLQGFLILFFSANTYRQSAFLTETKNTETKNNKTQNNTKQKEKNKTKNTIHNSYFSSKSYYDEAYLNLPAKILPTIKEKVYGGIIPHHLFVKNYLASYFNALSLQKYKTIILIGPNHFNKGKSEIISSKGLWLTPYGSIEPNLELIEKLSQANIVKIDEVPFYGEHSVSGLVPFIKKTFPSAKIVPIILKANLKEENAQKLATFIQKNVNPKSTLVLASVDFSHYLPAQVADFHDKRNNSIIKNFDFKRVYSMEIDSPPSIYTLLKYLKQIKTPKATLAYHTNSGYATPDEPCTTHNFYYFSKGEKEKNNLISAMFFGDMMLDRYIKTIIQKNGLDYLFKKINGGENRFWRGVDIISANFEGALTNNGHYPPKLINDFAFDKQDVAELKKYNFNFFNLANNHFSDQGKKGIEETRKNLSELNFNYSGCIDRKVNENCSATIIEKGGYKIAMLGFSMVYGNFDLKKAQEIIQKNKKLSDFLIINIHWGKEYKHQFNKNQEKVAHALIDAGADLIIGHHPHIVQGIEIYKEKAIFYSLGNFIFDQYYPLFPRDNIESFALAISFDKKKTEYNLFPFSFDKWQLELMKQKEKNIFLKKLLNYSHLKTKYANQLLKANIIINN